MITLNIFIYHTNYFYYQFSEHSFLYYFTNNHMNQTLRTTFTKSQYSNIRLHYFFTYKSNDYLLLLSEDSQLFIYYIINGEIRQMTKHNILSCNPINFFISNQDELFLVHTQGVLIWTLTADMQLLQSNNLPIQFPAIPIKIFPINSKQFTIICEKNIILRINIECNFRQKIHCCQQICMDRCVYGYSNEISQNAYIVFPCKQYIYPLLLNCKDINLWKNQQFFKEYIHFSRNYNLFDDKLPQQKYLINYDGIKQLVYIICNQKLIILQGKKINDEKMVFIMRLKINMNIKNCIYSNLDPNRDQIVYITTQRIGFILPFQYQSTCRSIKQKKQSILNYAYLPKHNYVVMISNHSSKIKIYSKNLNPKD